MTHSAEASVVVPSIEGLDYDGAFTAVVKSGLVFDHVATLRLNTATDEVEAGHWFHGRDSGSGLNLPARRSSECRTRVS
jgi:hypothetical protein